MMLFEIVAWHKMICDNGDVPLKISDRKIPTNQEKAEALQEAVLNKYFA